MGRDITGVVIGLFSLLLYHLLSPPNQVKVGAFLVPSFFSDYVLYGDGVKRKKFNKMFPVHKSSDNLSTKLI